MRVLIICLALFASLSLKVNAYEGKILSIAEANQTSANGKDFEWNQGGFSGREVKITLDQENGDFTGSSCALQFNGQSYNFEQVRITYPSFDLIYETFANDREYGFAVFEFAVSQSNRVFSLVQGAFYSGKNVKIECRPDSDLIRIIKVIQ